MVDITESVTVLNNKVDIKFTETFKSTVNLENKFQFLDTEVNKKIQNLEKKLLLQETVVSSEVTTTMPVDPRVIRDSLPEYCGRPEECPKGFIKTSEALLSRTNIPEEIYPQIISQQLKGSAATWWQNIRGLSLVWEEFKREFLQRF